ncbi:MAG: lysophospholipid acyltransferase family protein [Gammaproteobacteria bacterium]|nr:lysophospholipid acyltransferase family protein [Gammaproteobacteria bacterium]
MIRSALWFLWLVLTLIPFAVVLLLLSVFSRVSAYRVAKAWLNLVVVSARWIAGVQYRVQGMENLPAAGSLDPVILCPKHQSTWETFALPAMMSHPLAFVFKKELLMIPFFGWAIGRLDMVHIDRSKHSEAWNKVAEQGQLLMAKGVWIIMFPEGTRTARGKQGNYKSGATRLAVATGAAVVPIAVSSAKCWPRRTFRLSPGIIDVSIARPIPSAGREPDELMKEVETWVEAEMRRLDPEAYA